MKDVKSIFPSWTVFSTSSDEPVHPRTGKPRSQHYRDLAIGFRSDGCDEYNIPPINFYVRNCLMNFISTVLNQPQSNVNTYLL